MRYPRCLLLGALLIGGASLTAQEPANDIPFVKWDAKKLPPAVRPKNLPKEVLAVLADREGRYDCFAFRPDGKLLVIGSGNEGVVRFFDLVSLRLTGQLKVPDTASIAFSPSGKTIALGSGRGTVRFVNFVAGRPTISATIQPHPPTIPVLALAFSPDGKYLAVGGDTTLKLWDVSGPTPVEVAKAGGHEKPIRSLAFSPDGSRLATAGGQDRMARLWKIVNGKIRYEDIFTLNGPVSAVAFSPDGQMLATSVYDSTIRIFEVESRKEKAKLVSPQKRVASVSFSADSKTVIGLVRWNEMEDYALLWNVEGKLLGEFHYGEPLKEVVFTSAPQHAAVLTDMSVYLLRLPR